MTHITFDARDIRGYLMGLTAGWAYVVPVAVSGCRTAHNVETYVAVGADAIERGWGSLDNCKKTPDSLLCLDSRLYTRGVPV